jgi:hypothetical protein
MEVDLCKDFSIRKTAEGIAVVTPFRYDDGDSIVVFVRQIEDGTYRIDDNGEAATRLIFEGLDLDSTALQAWLSNLSMLHNIAWDDEKEALTTNASQDMLERRILAVAEASAQMQALVALKRERRETNFKEQVIRILQEVQAETKIEARYNVPVDKAQQLYADAYFASKTPLIIVAANNAERLLEAELMWANAQRLGDPSYIVAVVENIQAVGARQFQRAGYYTDKTVEFSGMPEAFRQMVATRLHS